MVGGALLRCSKAVLLKAAKPADGRRSEARGKFGEGSADAFMGGLVGPMLVVAAAQVLHERVAGGDDAQRADRLDSAHGS